MPSELIIRERDGTPRQYALTQDCVDVGRSAVNDLHFEDEGLSRKHLVLECRNGGWVVTDCLSKNGTFLNGKRIIEPQQLRSGDRIAAGHVVLEFRDGDLPTPITWEHKAKPDRSEITATNLEIATSRALTPDPDNPRASEQMRALIRVGRELAARRPLAELFQIIVDLLIESVGAPRGVLMTAETGEPVIRAMRGHPPGEPFHLARYVRQRVLGNRESLLEKDIIPDTAFTERNTLYKQKIRSFIAVPLQTDQRVLGLIYLDSPNFIHEFTNADLDLLTVMANIAALHIEHARMAEVEEMERQVRRELEQAAEIQRILLPTAPPKVDGLDLAGYSIPCRTIGGDYYDFLSCPDGRIAMIVADVTGHGLPAALLMSNLQARVEMLFAERDNIADVVVRLNQMVCCHVPVNKFISFFAAIIEPQGGDMQYCNAGHNPPLLVRADGTLQRLEATGTLLGILPEAPYTQQNLRMDAGDTLVLYSDGVTEALRPGTTDDYFGEPRLAGIATGLRDAPAISILNAIGDQLTAWIGKADPADDITLVVAKKK